MLCTLPTCALITVPSQECQAPAAAFYESSPVRRLAYQQHTVAPRKPSVYKRSFSHGLSTPPRTPRPRTTRSAARKLRTRALRSARAPGISGQLQAILAAASACTRGRQRRPGTATPRSAPPSAARRLQQLTAGSHAALLHRPTTTANRPARERASARRPAVASCARLRLPRAALNQAAKQQQNLLTHASFSNSPLSAEHQLAHRGARARHWAPVQPRPRSHSASCRATAPWGGAARHSRQDAACGRQRSAAAHPNTRQSKLDGPSRRRASAARWCLNTQSRRMRSAAAARAAGHGPGAPCPLARACLFRRLRSKQAQSRPARTDASRPPDPGPPHPGRARAPQSKGAAAPSSPLTTNCR
jgi:hypothetical protein